MVKVTNRKAVAERLRSLKRAYVTQRKAYLDLKRKAFAPRVLSSPPVCIPKDKLKPGHWYLGIGRGSNVAFWDGDDQEFKYIEEIMGEKTCHHWDDGPPFGCFQPFEEIELYKYGRECAFIKPTKPHP